MQKIPIETLISFISQTEEESSKDPELDLDLSEFLLVFPGSGAYDWRITPNPETVEFGYADLERLGRLDLDRLNTMARRARERRFRARLAAGDKSPVIVTEGDSWFQFPFFRKRVADLVDHLETDYLTWCVSAAGDTAWDMTHTRGRFEYMKALIAAQKNPKTRPQAFLMSMGGNEFIGSIDGILKSRPDLSSRNPDDYLDEGWIRYIIYMLDHCFRKVINDVRSVSDFSDLPIFFHGYEYVFPYPWGILDNRSPTYVKRDHFIGQHFENRGVNDRYTRKLVCDRIIDITCDVVKGAINTYGDRNVHFVDLRNTLHDQNDWFDEIHPTYHGAQQLAAIFSKEIKRHLPSS